MKISCRELIVKNPKGDRMIDVLAKENKLNDIEVESHEWGRFLKLIYSNNTFENCSSFDSCPLSLAIQEADEKFKLRREFFVREKLTEFNGKILRELFLQNSITCVPKEELKAKDFFVFHGKMAMINVISEMIQDSNLIEGSPIKKEFEYIREIISREPKVCHSKKKELKDLIKKFPAIEKEFQKLIELGDKYILKREREIINQ